MPRMARTGREPGIPTLFSVVLAAVAGIALQPASAYVGSRTDSGTPVAWTRDVLSNTFHLNFVLNPANSTGLSTEDVRRSLIRSLSRWKQAMSGVLSWDFWTGSDSGTYAANTSYDGYSRVYFASQDTSRSGGASANVIGLTQVWYNTSNGQILEADVLLNDVHFAFSNRVSDTTGTGNGASAAYSGGKRMVYIDNVLTHELGHVLGLSHSGVMQATMLSVEAPQQAHLSCDDRTGIQAVYPTRNFQATRGTLTGSVVSQSGGAVAGAHVVAISRRRGVALASGLTDSGGAFSISGLEAGDYSVMVEPFFAGPSSVPSFYSAMNPNVCSGAQFVRSFQTTDGRRLVFTRVGGGARVSAGTIVANCSGTTATGSSVELLSGQGYVENGAQTFVLRGISGTLELKLLSHSLFFANTASVQITGPSGVVAAQVANPSFSGSSGYKNYDTLVRAEGLTAGDYTVRVTPVGMSANFIPGSALGANYTQTYVVIALANETSSPAAAGELPWNARCEAADTGEGYVGPGGNPPKNGQSSVGFCGTIAATGARAPIAGAELAGWFLSFFGWGVGAAAMRKRKALKTYLGL